MIVIVMVVMEGSNGSNCDSDVSCGAGQWR